ncbi:MAG TPA: PstS family phosphate ABC transporter substrate-binding protein [Anaerolineales bacterium]
MTKFFRTSMFVIIAMSFLLAACGSATATEAPAVEPTFAPTEPVATVAEPTTAATEAPTEDAMAMYAPSAVSGDIIAAGSSTVFPLADRMKQRFEEEGFGGNITIDSIGSGAGFERFCKNGETDIATASRPIKDTEIESCAALATPREPIGFQVGIDALAITVSKENTWLTDVTKAELAQIFSTATNWSDVRPEWPAEPIQRFSPGTDSGTFDYFVEAIMGPANLDAAGKADLAKGEEAILNAADIQLSEDDNVLVQGVEGSEFAIGYFGYAYYQENADRLNILSVEGIAPTAETAESGEYPLARPLFIYSDANIMQEKPQVASFIWFFLNNVNNEIGDVGYFPISDAKLQEGIDAWKTATGV